MALEASIIRPSRVQWRLHRPLRGPVTGVGGGWGIGTSIRSIVNSCVRCVGVCASPIDSGRIGAWQGGTNRGEIYRQLTITMDVVGCVIALRTGTLMPFRRSG